MSLDKDFADKNIALKRILSATNNFADKNLISEDGFGRIYKGRLRDSRRWINIVAKRLDPKYGHGHNEFLTQILMLSNLEHQNLISFIGFCDEKEEKIIIIKYVAKSSLQKYLCDPAVLPWMQRLKICVGVARALSYLCYDEGRDFGVIHLNIKSSNILLDDKWRPRLSGFELSVKNPIARRHSLQLTDVSGSYGYVDPVYEKTGGVTHKSDMFSLGVVLFEVLCGRRAFVSDERSQMFSLKTLQPFNAPKDGLLSQLAKAHYEEGKLDDIINPDLRKQMDPRSYKIFSRTAYNCLKEHRARRPNIHQVLKRLKKAMKLQYEYDHLNDSIDAAGVEECEVRVYSSISQLRDYSSLSQNPSTIEELPFLYGNPTTNQVSYSCPHAFSFGRHVCLPKIHEDGNPELVCVAE